MADHPTRELIDDLDALLGALPAEIVAAIHALPNQSALIEVVLDLGRVPEARFPDSEVTLLDREVTEADIALVVEKIGSFGDDNRAGIERTLHRISAIRNRAGKIVGLTCRIGRAVYGTIEIIGDVVDSGQSILIMCRTDLVKTTMERETARLLGTAHGNNLDNLMLNPTLSDLIGGIQSVTLGDEEARRRRTQKSVLERKAPPTFDVIVEIQDRERVMVHADVGETIDAMLRGDPVAPELRW